jgi:methanogenic corrinoid protein MtbC1
VAPGRSDGGQRLYSEEDVVRLVLLRNATAQGHSIGEIATLDTSALEALSARRGIGAAVEGDGSDAVIAAAMAATEELDHVTLESTLKRAVMSLGATRFIDTIVSDLLRQVGDRWHAGTLSPAHEHLASHTVRRVLGWVADAYEPAARAPTIVVATPAGELHELGAMAAAAAAAEEGWRVVYLGPNLPAADVAAATAQVRAELVALSVVYANGEVTASEIREMARALPDGKRMIIGGAAGKRVAADRLEPNVAILDDVGALRRLLRARREPGTAREE